MAQNQIGGRLVFENAKNFIASQGYNVGHAVLTQSYIRSEVALNTSNALYTFPVVTNSSLPTFNTARAVQLQDIHVVSEIGFFLAKPNSGTDTTFPLFTYPNQGVFAVGLLSYFSLYNAYFNLQINNQNVVPAIDIFRSYVVNQTQGPAAAPPPYFDQLNGNSDGFTAIEPNILINGAANIVAQVVMPAALATVDANARLVCIMRSILAQNVTSVK